MARSKFFMFLSFFIASLIIGNGSTEASLKITVQTANEPFQNDLGPSDQSDQDVSHEAPKNSDTEEPENLQEDSSEFPLPEVPDLSESEGSGTDEIEALEETPPPERKENNEGSSPDASESLEEESVEKNKAEESEVEKIEEALPETSEQDEREGLDREPDDSKKEKVEGPADEELDALPDESLEEEKLQWNFGLLFDMESGDMTYTIQGKEDGGWKSELEWPLDNVIYAGAEASLNFRKKWRVQAEFLKAVTDDAGTLKDSDWFYGYYDDQVAVYSETSTSIDAYSLDMNLEYRVVRKARVSFGGLLGYSYNHWDWTGGDGYQWTIDPFSHYQGPITGPAITYEADLYVPYLGLNLAFLSGNSKIDAELSALYSPFAIWKDESDHLLRDKKGEGDTSGNFFALRSHVRWNLNVRWSFGARASIATFDLDGDQTQYYYGGENAGTGESGIDMNVKGTQTHLGLMLGYSL